MKAKLLFEMSTDELKNKLESLKQELFNLRFKHAVGQLENANQLAICKKDIARVNTILRQRELGISQEVAPEKNSRAKKAAK